MMNSVTRRPTIICQERSAVQYFLGVYMVMSNFKIVTDSCCDFTDKMYQEYDVACAPLSVLYKGVARESAGDATSSLGKEGRAASKRGGSEKAGRNQN